MKFDIDALIADNRKWVQLHRENKYQREAAKRMTGVLDALEDAQRKIRAAEGTGQPTNQTVTGSPSGGPEPLEGT